MFAAGSGLQHITNDSVFVIIISLLSLSNTSAGSDAGTESLSKHALGLSPLNTHSEALFVHIWGSWLLTSATCPLSWVIVLQTSQCNEWLRFLSAASLKLQTGARMTARARSWVNIIKSKCQFKLQPVNLRQIILHYYPVTFVLIGFTVEPRAFLSSDSITVIGWKRMWHWPQQGYAPCRACTRLSLWHMFVFVHKCPSGWASRVALTGRVMDDWQKHRLWKSLQCKSRTWVMQTSEIIELGNKALYEYSAILI